jgi:hypothetical protein
MAGYVTPVQTIGTIIPGFGSPSQPAFQALNQTQAAAATTTVLIPSSGVLNFNNANVTLSRGYIRARFSGVVNTPTVILLVTATDGTNTVILFLNPITAALVATTGEIEFCIPFFSERSFNKFTFAATLAGAAGTAQADYEVCGNP